MQTLHQELGPSQPAPPDDHPVLQGLVEDQARAYAEEVRALRHRVALLESELAAAKATQSAGASAHSGASSSPTNTPASTSEFSQELTPAVVAVSPPMGHTPGSAQSARVPATPPIHDHAAEDEMVPDPGFAEAWRSEGVAVSFEERIAERAFFQASTVDEESRSWLLAQ